MRNLREELDELLTAKELLWSDMYYLPEGCYEEMEDILEYIDERIVHINEMLMS